MNTIKTLLFLLLLGGQVASADVASDYLPLIKKVRLNLPEEISTDCEAVDYYMNLISYRRIDLQDKIDFGVGFCNNTPKFRLSRKAKPLYFVINAITNKRYTFYIDVANKLYSIAPINHKDLK